MIYVHGIRDIPTSFLNSVHRYSIQYELFGQSVKIPIRFDVPENMENNLFKITIEKIKVFYLFA
jgi:hypothetical protein